jgi:hypothetical protein
LYGSSFRFRVMRESIDAKPARSSYNPEQLPERPIREARLFEFGPVTFHAYAGRDGAACLTVQDEHPIDDHGAESGEDDLI